MHTPCGGNTTLMTMLFYNVNETVVILNGTMISKSGTALFENRAYYLFAYAKSRKNRCKEAASTCGGIGARESNGKKNELAVDKSPADDSLTAPHAHIECVLVVWGASECGRHTSFSYRKNDLSPFRRYRMVGVLLIRSPGSPSILPT